MRGDFNESGGPAYPTNADKESGGLTMLEHYAGQAMNGLLAQHPYVEGDYPILVRDAFKIAELMVQESRK